METTRSRASHESTVWNCVVARASDREVCGVNSAGSCRRTPLFRALQIGFGAAVSINKDAHRSRGRPPPSANLESSTLAGIRAFLSTARRLRFMIRTQRSGFPTGQALMWSFGAGGWWRHRGRHGGCSKVDPISDVYPAGYGITWTLGIMGSRRSSAPLRQQQVAL